ncbi:hypothetical protein CAI21_01410 [Alkalilimnicola ehrlichii]|uniref:DUF4224 domain-containing protein n=1 Tax=Alkalilimnicola ehrlichii TaxID=351052 RepID=A0A3E0X3J4_9GAMM|nr:DUF4224 domain-containing protein [Alkalilimnicola ehrlichii]RFA31314.1 hypothetical protein CAI21_01410 [Alkalilimnicola ehrlichii]RFA39412.1 hypothetical protein CAL65_01000 [Alkalilimnicola ehrlichii]
MSLFLSDDELYQLTARKRQSAQIRWLERNGVKFTLNAEGRPRILRSHIEKVLGGDARPTRTQPNVKALMDFTHGKTAN